MSTTAFPGAGSRKPARRREIPRARIRKGAPGATAGTIFAPGKHLYSWEKKPKREGAPSGERVEQTCPSADVGILLGKPTQGGKNGLGRFFFALHEAKHVAETARIPGAKGVSRGGGDFF